ncbi:hypothetical protein NQ317_018866 [Molorchus minor]|uniref:Integrase catalytic domain-containing protein n=1 Tax=Molorchus minor TaxID=1323400 RepID=A0ABQ9JDZ7_9CUCU|nr:hypothetical protein NQ317_018866 [Molorchus minor]
MWKDVKIVHGKPRHSQTQGSVERANQDIQNMLTAWMQDNDSNKWSEGLPFVQFAKNTTYHEGIRQSPYGALFGVKLKRGIASSSLPRGQIVNIETEEQLGAYVNTFEENLDGSDVDNQNTILVNLEPSTSSSQVLAEQQKLISSKRVAAKRESSTSSNKNVTNVKKKFTPAQIGDTDSGFYKLASKNGTLKQLFTRNQFVICKEKLLSIDEVSIQEMSLREAACANSKSGGKGYTRCN